jgi:hypothetical protein
MPSFAADLNDAQVAGMNDGPELIEPGITKASAVSRNHLFLGKRQSGGLFTERG